MVNRLVDTICDIEMINEKGLQSLENDMRMLSKTFNSMPKVELFFVLIRAKEEFTQIFTNHFDQSEDCLSLPQLAKVAKLRYLYQQMENQNLSKVVTSFLGGFFQEEPLSRVKLQRLAE